MKSKRNEFIAAALSSDTDDCIRWPFAVRRSSGYGAHNLPTGSKNKKINVDAHRYVCELAHGKPEAGMEAAHSCGDPLCVNPRHLRWADHPANMADAKEAGTLIGGGRYRQRFFAPQIEDILSSNESLSELARKYQSDVAYIGRLRREYLRRAA
jgi:hypothetical protein